jgi:hypothetical protein
MRFRGRLAVVAAAISSLLSCAHDQRPEERRVAARAPSPPPAARRREPAPARRLNRRAMLGIANTPYETWIAQVRACTPAEMGRAKPQLPGTREQRAKQQPAVSIEGRLMPTAPDCNLIECGGEVDGVYRSSPCCNICGFEWVVIPRRCPAHPLHVGLQGGGMDCAALGFGPDADWVIVTGRIGGQGDVVVDADLCKLSSPQKDQLRDDELERLASPASARGEGTSKLDCPAR